MTAKISSLKHIFNGSIKHTHTAAAMMAMMKGMALYLRTNQRIFSAISIFMSSAHELIKRIIDKRAMEEKEKEMMMRARGMLC